MLRFVVLAFLLPLAAWPAPPRAVTLTLDKYCDLPALGWRFRPFKDYRPRPIPALEVVFYENTQTGEKAEAHNLRALWQHEQQVALLGAEYGSIEIAALRHVLPPGVRLLNNRDTFRGEYERALLASRSEWTPASIGDWVAQYVDCPLASRTPTPRGFGLSVPCEQFLFQDRAAELLQGYVLELPGSRAPLRLLVLFRFEPGVQVRNAAASIPACLRSFAAGVGSAPEDIGVNRNFQNRQTLPGAKERSPEFEATRQRVIESLRQLPGWWYVATPNYLVVSNLSRENRRLVEQVQGDLELLRHAYERYVPTGRASREVSVVRIFASREEYLAYIPKEVGWTGGVWMPTRKELVISPLNERLISRQARDTILDVVYHEAFHQYIFYALDQMQPPVWYDEGHASMFEAATIDHSRGQVRVGENPRLAALLEAQLRRDRNLDLAAFMTMPHQAFYADPDRRSGYYALAWGLCYFLRKGASLYPNGRYERLLEDTIAALRDARGDWDQAARAGLARVDMKPFTRDFYDFWSSSSKRKAALGNEP